MDQLLLLIQWQVNMKINELLGINSFIFYHVTPTRNLSSILKHGLQPDIGVRSRRIKEKIPAIYLFDNLNSIEDALSSWMEVEFDEDEELSLLKITLPSNIRAEDTGFEYAVYENIPKKYIKVLSTDIMNEPNISKLVIEMTSAGNVAGVSMPMGMARRVDPQTLINTYPDHTKPKNKSKKKKNINGNGTN